MRVEDRVRVRVRVRVRMSVRGRDRRRVRVRAREGVRVRVRPLFMARPWDLRLDRAPQPSWLGLGLG